MDTAPFKKIAAATAAEVVGRFKPTPPAKKLLGADDGVPAYLAKLMETGLLQDAVNLLAHGLPRREATWWACLAARATLPAEPEPEDLRALEAAERWVFKPGEETRGPALLEANAPDRDLSPALMAASAAAWSGGSLAPPDAPEVPPGERMTPVAVYTGVLLAAYRTEPERGEDKLRHFLAQAVDIAKGGSGRLEAAQPAGQA